MSSLLVISVSFAYLLLLFAVAYWADQRAAVGRSVIGSAWVYALSMAVYCTAWTYFGSVGRAATAGVWFLPIYLGPMLAMILAWLVLRKMIRIAKTYRITSIADFISSRYGKSPWLAGLVTLITIVGIVPYIALQLKGISVAYAVLTTPVGDPLGSPQPWWRETTLYLALGLAGFTMVFGARHLDNSERHEGLVAAMAFESLVKLLAFVSVGLFVTYGLFDGVADIAQRAMAVPQSAALLSLGGDRSFADAQWFTLTVLAMLSVILLPRQFQMMVVENVDERHLKRAVWVFPLYLFLINLFVLPIALGGLLYFDGVAVNPETFVLSLPLAEGWYVLALVAFLGGLSAATGMVIVETIAVSTMVCNDWVMPVLLRSRRWVHAQAADLSRLLLWVRRLAILLILLLGYAYYRVAGEAYALVSIGLISFAAVAQFAPALLGGMYWKGGTRQGAMTGLALGFAVWSYTLMWPSLAKSGWVSDAVLADGLFGMAWLRPEALLGLTGLDNLTHSLFWSMLLNIGAYVLVSLWRTPSAQETSQAVLFVDVFERTSTVKPVFWRGQARVADLLPLAERFLGPDKARAEWQHYAAQRGFATIDELPADAHLVQFVETQLAGAIGSASARVMMASAVKEEALGIDDVMDIVDEATRLRLHSRELEAQSRSLELASAELRSANQQLKSLDRLKDDFMSSVTHELRTPLTAIRTLSELMRDDPRLPLDDRKRFLDIIVSESERLSRLVNQVLDMAKIESGHAQWHTTEVDAVALVSQVMDMASELLRDKNARLSAQRPDHPVMIWTDADRFTQVLLNLIGNAAKFVPTDGGQIEIRLRAEPEALVVEVVDNGPGIAADQQSVIFDKFRQGGDPANRPQGTGLGLPISRQIVEHLGGRMWVQSTPGHGALFGFELPYHGPMETAHERQNSDRRR